MKVFTNNLGFDCSMHLKSLEGCRLKIGSYPSFSYNAYGGGGEGTLMPSQKSSVLYLNFSSKEFSIPPLTLLTCCSNRKSTKNLQ